jgi:hypothetical protein
MSPKNAPRDSVLGSARSSTRRLVAGAFVVAAVALKPGTNSGIWIGQSNAAAGYRIAGLPAR